MHIAYLDGPRLRRGIIAGAALVRENATYLDSINVFPVADGDTGTNMAATVENIARVMTALHFNSAAAILRQAADAALSGARGNSGAIIAQFIHSLADELGQDVRLCAKAFAAAAHAAAERTWKAVSDPRDGTILSVLRDWSDSLMEKAENCDDFLQVLSHGLQAARRSLERTKTLLPEARKADVVDAGAGGFVSYLEGIQSFIAKGDMRSIDENTVTPELAMVDEHPSSEDGEEYTGNRYCVEALLENKSGNPEPVCCREALSPLGNSLICAGGGKGSPMRIHIHSDDPPAVFRILMGFGTVATQKVDDMLIQSNIVSKGQDCIVVVDSSADIPDEIRAELSIPRVPIRLTVEGSEYLDRDALKASDLAEKLVTEPALKTGTSQPAHGDFVRIFSHTADHCKELLYLGISGAVSGTLEAGRRAGKEVAEQKGITFRGIDTRSGSIGVALIARRCAMAAARGARGAELEELAVELRSRLGLRFALHSLDRLIQSGRLSKFAGLALKRLGIRPMLTLDNPGKIAKSGLFLGPGKIAEKLEREINKVAGTKVEDLAIAHVGEQKKAEKLAEILGDRLRPDRPVIITDLSPALAVHMGPGTLGVAWITAPKTESDR